MSEFVPPEPRGLNKKFMQAKQAVANPLFHKNKNFVQLEQVLALRGKYVRVEQLPIVTDDGPTTYTGKLKIYVKDHEPGETVELLTEQPYRTNAGQLTRVYARPEDILNARTN